MTTEPESQPEADPRLIDIVTTQIGAFGPEGLAPVGTRKMILPEDYSANWMRPATKAAAAKLAKHCGKDA